MSFYVGSFILALLVLGYFSFLAYATGVWVTVGIVTFAVVTTVLVYLSAAMISGDIVF